MNTSRSLLFFAVGGALLVGCVKHGPNTVDKAVRAEVFDEEHSTWLNAHCALVGAGEVIDPSMRSSETENYRVDLASATYEGVMNYACPEDPPWQNTWPAPLEKLVRNLESTAGFACTQPKPEGDTQVEIADPGSGEAPGSDSFVAVRVRTVRVKVVPLEDATFLSPGFGRVFHGRIITDRIVNPNWAEATPEPPDLDHMVDVDGPPVLHVNHVTCVDRLYGGAISRLRTGGRARVTRTNVPKPRGRGMALRVVVPDQTWEVELVRVGGEELLRRHFGL